MNELVRPGCGVLTPYAGKTPRHLGWNYNVDPEKLTSVIDGLIAAPLSEKARMGKAGRKWFDCNSQEFKENLRRLLTLLTPPMPLR